MGWRERLEANSLLRPALERLHQRRFQRTGVGAFRGVFNTFAEAVASAPRDKPLGFDHEANAKEFADRRKQIFAYDYPVLFWLRPLMSSKLTVFDFGGHTGLHYYAYSHYLPYPAGLRWIVCEVPQTAREGAALAAEAGAEQLEFVEDFAEADGADVFMAAGSLQYVEGPDLGSRLGTLRRLPKHLLLNKIPLHDSQHYVTLQNGGISYHPMHVFHASAFRASLESLGYVLQDQWEVPARHGRIPFHPQESFRSHSGLYFIMG